MALFPFRMFEIGPPAERPVQKNLLALRRAHLMRVPYLEDVPGIPLESSHLLERQHSRKTREATTLLPPHAVNKTKTPGPFGSGVLSGAETAPQQIGELIVSRTGTSSVLRAGPVFCARPFAGRA